MTVNDLMDRAHTIARSKPGHHYAPAELERLVREGLFSIPVNAPICQAGHQHLVYTGREVVSYGTREDGRVVETKRTPATEAVVEQLIVLHAVLASQLPTHTAA